MQTQRQQKAKDQMRREDSGSLRENPDTWVDKPLEAEVGAYRALRA